MIVIIRRMAVVLYNTLSFTFECNILRYQLMILICIMNMFDIRLEATTGQ
jgi:hypothetical protein